MQPRQSTGEGYLQSTAKNRGGPVPSGSTRSSTMVPVVHGPIPTALLARGPRKPGVQAYSTSEPCTRVASNSVTTVTPGTGSSITSTMTFSAAVSPCGGGGPGAFIGAFFVAARFAFVKALDGYSLGDLVQPRAQMQALLSIATGDAAPQRPGFGK